MYEVDKIINEKPTHDGSWKSNLELNFKYINIKVV